MLHYQTSNPYLQTTVKTAWSLSFHWTMFFLIFLLRKIPIWSKSLKQLVLNTDFELPACHACRYTHFTWYSRVLILPCHMWELIPPAEPETFCDKRSADRDLDRALVPERDLFLLNEGIRKRKSPLSLVRVLPLRLRIPIRIVDKFVQVSHFHVSKTSFDKHVTSNATKLWCRLTQTKKNKNNNDNDSFNRQF